MGRLLLIAAVCLLARGARAAESPVSVVTLLAEPGEAPMPKATESAPPPAPPGDSTERAADDPKRQGVIVPAADVADDAEPTRPADLSFGVATRMRWISVPGWLLDVFTKENVPLSSWAAGFEVFRRKDNLDFALAFTYQAMSPPDGNWLGKDHRAEEDTDYVQFRGLKLFGIDASFIWHARFTDWVGLHYGAGIGIGFVGGEVLRTSNAGCTEDNAGDLTNCKPLGVDCTGGVCNEQQIRELPRGPTPDSPGMPTRFKEGNIPPVIPIINAVVGLNFRLPNVRGWEAKVEGGFYAINFFLGGGIGYTF